VANDKTLSKAWQIIEVLKKSVANDKISQADNDFGPISGKKLMNLTLFSNFNIKSIGFKKIIN
jgi:hypothetical protein